MIEPSFDRMMAAFDPVWSQQRAKEKATWTRIKEKRFVEAWNAFVK